MKIQFERLLPWAEEILSAIKKEIKQEYLEENPVLRRKHFGNLPQNRISTPEIAAAFTKEILDGNQELYDWVVDTWVVKHGNMYHYFALKLHNINPDFEQIKELTVDESEKVLAGAKESFGAKKIYFFAVLNGLVFPEQVLTQLHQDATNDR
jgi:hypothetical protein